jgi:hypothetical protein
MFSGCLSDAGRLFCTVVTTLGGIADWSLEKRFWTDVEAAEAAFPADAAAEEDEVVAAEESTLVAVGVSAVESVDDMPEGPASDCVGVAEESRVLSPDWAEGDATSVVSLLSSFWAC